MVLGNGGDALGQIDLEGTLTANFIRLNKDDAVANFNGGTLIAATSAAEGLIWGGGGTLNVRNDGITIDTNGFEAVINRGLTHSSIPGDDEIDGGLLKVGEGKLILTEDSSYTGPTEIFEGTLQVGNGSTSGTISDEILNDGLLIFNRSDDLVINTPISGFGGITQAGTGRLTLAAEADFIGNTTVTNGILELDNGDAIDNSTRLTIQDSGTVELTQDETVNELFIGLAPQDPGTYGAPGSGATNINDDVFLGEGVLTVLDSGTAEGQVWDTSSDPNIQPESGDWNTTAANWSANGTTLVPWDPTLPSVFGGINTTATITLTEDLTSEQLEFETSGFTLDGDDPARILTLNGPINLGAGTSNSIGENLTITRAAGLRIGQPAIQNSGSLSILAGANVQSTGDLNIEGFGTDVTVSGVLQVTGGTGRINLGSNQLSGNEISLTIESGGQVFTETDPEGGESNNLIQVGFAGSGANPANVKGTVTVKDGGLLRSGTGGDRTIRLGQFGTGTLNIEPGGLVQGTSVVMGNGGDGTGFLNLEGTLETEFVNMNRSNSRVYFNGGTLKAYPTGSADFFTGGVGIIFVRDGGLFVDTNGIDKSIFRELRHSTNGEDSDIDGGLNKIGLGKLTLTATNTYTGPTTVSVGTLDLDNGNAIPDSNSLRILDGATVQITQSETVDSLFFNSEAKLPGTYGASGSGAMNIDNDRFAGPGRLTVLNEGSANDYDIWITEFTFLPDADTTPTGDADSDGIDNNCEYAFGLDPSDPSSVNPISMQLEKASGMFSYTRRDPSLTGLSYRVQTSTDLVNWSDDDAATQNPGTTDSNGNQTVEVTLSIPLPEDKLFVQVIAE